jgi:hypothetical protein
MSLRSKLKTESFGVLAAFTFYAVVGIICFVILAVDFRLIHIGVIGILSLITTFGLLKSRVWTIWVVVALFFIATTSSTYMFYSAFGKDLLLDVSMIVYLLFTWIFTAYTVVKRRAFES